MNDTSQATAYADVSVVVDGAIEEEERFFDETLLTDYIRQIEEEAKSDGYLTEIYVHYHEHPPNIECECLQYEQDHHPAYTFNAS